MYSSHHKKGLVRKKASGGAREFEREEAEKAACRYDITAAVPREHRRKDTPPHG